MVFNLMKTVSITHRRTFKNFGHKRQPPPIFTVLWQGFLTVSFISLGIEWKKIARYFLGEDHGIEDAPWLGSADRKPEDMEHSNQEAVKS